MINEQKPVDAGGDALLGHSEQGERTIRKFRMDEWTVCYDAPTAVPGELSLRGGVFRGMRDETAACAYADQVSAFFVENGARNTTAFVVRGSTSTTKEPFEVVDTTAGYTVVYRSDATRTQQLDAQEQRRRLKP